jgi:hypothetical protein
MIDGSTAAIPWRTNSLLGLTYDGSLDIFLLHLASEHVAKVPSRFELLLEQLVFCLNRILIH